MNIIKSSIVLILIFFGFESHAVEIPTSSRAEKSIASVEPRLTKELASKGLEYGSPIFIRIFKKSSTLELWVESNDGTYEHFKSYRICRFSGDLGPKTKQGDYQSHRDYRWIKRVRGLELIRQEVRVFDIFREHTHLEDKAEEQDHHEREIAKQAEFNVAVILEGLGN